MRIELIKEVDKIRNIASFDTFDEWVQHFIAL